MSVKPTKGKIREEKPKPKVMHFVNKNSDGTFSIDSNSPKLKESVGPDVVQQAEETGHKLLKDKPKAQPSKPKTEKPKDELTEDQVKVLKALVKLGGTSNQCLLRDISAGTRPANPRQEGMSGTRWKRFTNCT